MRSCSADGESLIGGFYPYWAESEMQFFRGLKDKAANVLSCFGKKCQENSETLRIFGSQSSFVVHKLS